MIRSNASFARLPRATLIAAACAALASPIAAQFITNMQPQTSHEFDTYIGGVLHGLEARWEGQRAFLSIEDNPQDVARVHGGDLLIRPAASPNPHQVFQGLIHDWVGDVFIPGVQADRVVAVLENFTLHGQFSKELTRSRVIHKDGDHVVGRWRVQHRAGLVQVVLDIVIDARYQQVVPGKWASRNVSESISEVEDAGSKKEKILPFGTGHGYLWRLNTYWSIEKVNDGVLAECRTVSLSRDIPAAIVSLVKPFIDRQPRESLEDTLRSTRKLAEGRPPG